MHSAINKLLRWKIIAVEFEQYRNCHQHLPTTQIYSRFIYPKFLISKSTLNSVLATPIDKKLKGLGYTQDQINKHVEKHNSVVSAPVNSGPAVVSSDNPYMKNGNRNQFF